MKALDVINKIKSVTKYVAKVISYIAVGLTLLFVIVKTYPDRVVIEHISLPTDISSKIITEKGIANKLVNKINYIAKVANKQSYDGATQVLNQKPYDVDNSRLTLQVEHETNQLYLPGGNTIDGYIDFLRKIFGIKGNKVYGEIYTKGKSYYISLSITGSKGNTVDDIKVDVDDIDKALVEISEKILLFNDPFMLARYYMQVNDKRFSDVIDIVVNKENDSIKLLALNTYGIYYLVHEKYYNAIDKFKLSLKLKENAHAYYGLSKCYFSLNEYDRAIDMANKMTLLNYKKDSEAYVITGQCLHKKFKFDEAIKKYQAAININPKDAEAYFYWGITLLHPSIKKTSEAIEKLKIATSIDNTFLAAHVQIAINSYKLLRYDDALHHFKEASKLNAIYMDNYKAVEQEYETSNKKMINEILKNKKVDMSTTNNHEKDCNLPE